MMKKFLCTAALVCLSLAAGSKQYSVTLSQTVRVGSVKLAPGDYKVQVDGTTATFTDSHKKTFTAPVKIEKLAKKNGVTAIETKKVDGAEQIDVIDVGGADFKLVF
jgi:hypothetical protein